MKITNRAFYRGIVVAVGLLTTGSVLVALMLQDVIASFAGVVFVVVAGVFLTAGVHFWTDRFLNSRSDYQTITTSTEERVTIEASPMVARFFVKDGQPIPRNLLWLGGVALVVVSALAIVIAPREVLTMLALIALGILVSSIAGVFVPSVERLEFHQKGVLASLRWFFRHEIVVFRYSHIATIIDKNVGRYGTPRTRLLLTNGTSLDYFPASEEERDELRSLLLARTDEEPETEASRRVISPIDT